jgi:hypothetical protein
VMEGPTGPLSSEMGALVEGFRSRGLAAMAVDRSRGCGGQLVEKEDRNSRGATAHRGGGGGVSGGQQSKLLGRQRRQPGEAGERGVGVYGTVRYGTVRYGVQPRPRVVAWRAGSPSGPTAASSRVEGREGHGTGSDAPGRLLGEWPWPVCAAFLRGNGAMKLRKCSATRHGLVAHAAASNTPLPTPPPAPPPSRSGLGATRTPVRGRPHFSPSAAPRAATMIQTPRPERASRPAADPPRTPCHPTVVKSKSSAWTGEHRRRELKLQRRLGTGVPERGGRAGYKMPDSARALCRMVSLTAAKTSRMLDVSVAWVRLEAGQPGCGDAAGTAPYCG